ncbi:MAG TPA: response regulator transcription factor [Polyangiaceae bacterium LLY-WYZ-15_(1-7)]|nr:DNA-binding response regulator [Sandaracinus sp.]HJK89270.1 response regulator transcription factor [Polyangiaceae bacterium LLY-WYZ-15_(1-7)]MBJ70825.1 DNA-binding response regulator [Sandaracinus sp.]HJL00800.1 response regulator transcription factor [Polyangiaceae bacterium LLY-WYZ-15_(1-7)]HJL13552.1 response regulator transcription factor [Polyangiaceae bacterium LLY-WYZ-15_(1-7)]
MKLLLVEDEHRFAKTVARGLREEGHQVDVCHMGEDARQQLAQIPYDVVILDWMLPDADGVSLLREWRREGHRVPVIMLTARGTVGERVTGLRAGADDYLVKPFAFEELLARIDALHRRAEGGLGTEEVGGVVLDARRHHLRRGEVEVALTPRELQLAAELFDHAGEVVTRSHLLTTVWGWDFEGDPNVLDVYVGYVRKKLAQLGEGAPRIAAVRGVGFRLEVPR